MPQGAALGLLLVFKTWDVSLVFLRGFTAIICKPGSLAWFIPENSSHATNLLSVHYFGTKTFVLGKGFIVTCSSAVISFAISKNIQKHKEPLYQCK